MSTVDEYVQRVVDAAPPLTLGQQALLSNVLKGRGDGLTPVARLDMTPPPVRKCAVYRHFDSDGVLLYVGISVKPGMRRMEHARHSAFMEFATRETVEWFDNEPDALNAERAAIRAERPLFNRVGADDDRDRRLVHYLVDKGALHLLKA